MLDWILEHWQLLASVAFALFNFVYALVVHSNSKRRLNELENPPEDIRTALGALLESSQAILEALNEKKNQ